MSVRKMKIEEQESDYGTPKKVKTKAAKVINGARGYDSEQEFSHDSATTSSSLVPQFGLQKLDQTPKNNRNS